MAINSVADIAEATFLADPYGNEGFSVREGPGASEGLMHWIPNQPGERKWLLCREWLALNESSNTWAADLAAAQAKRKDEVNDESHLKLANSDWYRIRAADGGAAVPSAWATYRTDVRAAANASWSDIDALAGIDDCRDHVPSWPASP